MTESSNPQSLAATAVGPDRALGGLMVVTGVLLFFGWILPIMTIDKLVFLTERISILESCLVLWEEQQYFLFFVIAVFSIVFPLVKLSLALYLWYQADAHSLALQRLLGWLEIIGRWSMLDVFAVAIAVVAIQLSLISEVTMHAGIYIFTLAIVLSLLSVQRMTALARRAARLQTAAPVRGA